ncbi:hypothetical protein [Nocardia otitidiscaviarum]|uniref:hypothetical protein n=1 Tax=Nocardia otitidiscaviarum TaxID=1823 RepID=UPI0018960AA4|nr:hypothetical protein [Nocardia otitidiscaviarum]MBF6180185.1 hypothetical protein [Nocardia otitidiscaviarum]
MAYTYQLLNYAHEVDLAESALLGMNSVHSVNRDNASESIVVTADLSYGEVLEVIRDSGISAR